MAVQIDATLPRTFDGGITANQIVEGFVSVRTAGAREIAKRLEEMALAAGRDPSGLMQKAVRAASQPIIKGYRNKVRNVTGNLGKSMTTRVRKYDGAAVAITGPRVTGPVGADPELGSGNHAWLVEFGTGRRKPGTQGRRTYVNVHQQINFRMTRAGTFNNQQFERMGKGYYFLMGSKNERTRQAKAGSGYPHDFGSDRPGEMHPISLQPGESIAPMPAQHPMEKTIVETNGEVLNILINRMQGFIDTL
jgi:hypothetical protein